MEQKLLKNDTDSTSIEVNLHLSTETKAHSSRRLILFFAGWGMDASVFASLSRPGYDIMLVYDYRSEDFDISMLTGYDEICVLAWSLGVWHADRFLSANPQLPVTRTIAVNGTLSPISKRYGIPPRIYDLTSRLPDKGALLKFFRRICGGETQMQKLMPQLPERSLDDLRDELLAVRARITEKRSLAADSTLDANRALNDAGIICVDSAKNADNHLNADNWDEIYLSDCDLIFPFENMSRAWHSASERVRVLPDAHHAIDFNRFIAGAFVDKALVGHRFASASGSYESEAEVQMKVAETMMELALHQLTDTEGKTVIEAGSGTGMFTRNYLNVFTNSNIQLWDLAPTQVPTVNGNRIEAMKCDAEMQIRSIADASVDFFFSSSTIQWFNSPRGFLREVVRTLSPGGKAFISCYVEGTLPQLSQLSGVAAMHYPQLDDLLPTLPDADCETFTQEFEMIFDTPAEALTHMRATGVNSLSRTSLSVAQTRRLMKLLTVDGKAVLKFNTKFIIITKHG